MPTENRSSNTENMIALPMRIIDRIKAEATLAPGIWEAIEVAVKKAEKPVEQQSDADTFPPCDYCGTVPNYHPWHGSGMLKGVENRHIHACDGCRSKLPAHTEQHQGEPVVVVPEGYCLLPRQLTAENGAKALLLGEFKLQVTCECPECQELEEPLEGCEICDGEGEYAQRHTIPWDQIKFIYSEAVKGLAIKPAAAVDRKP